MKPARAVSLIVGVGLLSVASWRAFQLTLADHRYWSGAGENVRRAIDLEPGRALYHVGLSEIEAAAGEDGRVPLERAAILKPDDAEIRMRLGLELEKWGDSVRAEDELLAAARVSRKYAPRWTLSNYYFRQGAADRFWHWARQALAVSFGDRRPLFELCWRTSPSPATILDRAIPDRRAVRLDFAAFLGDQAEWEAASGLLVELAGGAVGGETRAFLDAVDRLLGNGRFGEAVTVWNLLVQRGLLEFEPLDTVDGSGLTNGRFTRSPSGRGLDWRIPRVGGIYWSALPSHGLQFTFTGKQPDTCEVLVQFVPVEEQNEYRLDYSYRSVVAPLAIAPETAGLVWRVEFPEAPDALPSGSESLAANGSHNGAIHFPAPPGAKVARLVLVHKRRHGATKFEGIVVLEHVTLQHLESFQAQ